MIPDDVTNDDLDLLLVWVTYPMLHGKIAINEIEEKILEKYGLLPEQIDPQGKFNDYVHDNFIKELFEKIDYSNALSFLVLNKGRKYLTALWVFLFIVLFAIIFSLGTVFGLFNLYIDSAVYFIMPLLLIIFILNTLNEKIFNKIILNMKPGDILKILLAKDEIISLKTKPLVINESSIFSNPAVYTAFSKKKLICEYYRKKIKCEERNLFNLVVYFLATDYLIKTEKNKEVVEYLEEEALDALLYILAFKPNSYFTIYNIAFYQLNLLRLNESKKNFEECQKINPENVYVKTWISILSFLDKK
ncbi:hypothetical protein [Breznakiella homolactica]|uniref:Uncharacterized protein n=1 Tax=Breznakiella homolactica TaxID=2798577 RepID=A0A7T7XP47_9SPIR|nr:hypothetical protein [Breznakiella homolactica]QQO09924.1 hypothetical protein JFL75_03155 [Breznakiella homolactica]